MSSRRFRSCHPLSPQPLRRIIQCEIMKTWIGTSGFQYAEWKGTFYPEDLAAAKMLPYFAERLSTTEINYTFHRIPSPKTIENWKAQTPENFRFALKAPQKITHFAKLRDCQDTLDYFCRVISATRRSPRAGPVSTAATVQKERRGAGLVFA